MSHLVVFESLIKAIKNLISNEDQQPDEDLIAEKFKNVVQILVDADKTNKQQIYDMFCQMDVMEYLRRLVKFNKEVVVRTLSLLLINLRNQLWISYFMADKLILQIIETGIDEENEELIEHYISFLKSLSIRLDINNLSLFFNKKFCTFPLLYKGLSFYNHPDNMVRTSVMNLTLGIMKIKDQRLSKYFGTFPFTLYLIHFCHGLNHQWKQLNNTIKDPKLTKHRLKMEISDQNDSIYYLYDLFQHGSSTVKQNIKNILFTTTILPNLIHQLLKQQIQPKLILYLLHSFLKVFKQKDVSEFIAILLFGKRLNTQTIRLINTTPYKPQSFHEVFNVKDVSFFSDYQYNLTDHCEQLFKDIANFETQHQQKKSIGQTPQNSNQFFDELKIISTSVGFDVLSIDNQNIFNLLIKSKQAQNSEDNPIRQKVLKLFQEGDDSLVWIITNIIITIQKKQQISNDTLKYCGLLMPRLDTVNYLDDFNINSISNLKNILSQHLKKQSHYRIVTTRNIVYLISELFFKQLDKQQFIDLIQRYEQSISLLKSDLKIQNVEHLSKTFYDEFKRWSSYNFIVQGFIPFSVFSKPKQSFPEIKNQQHLPVNDKEYVTRNIQLFSLIRSLISTYRIECMKLNKDQIFDFELQYLNRFSITTNKWRVGKSYVIQNRNIVQCKEVFSDKRKPINLLLVEDPYNFVLVDPSTDNASATIYLNINYNHLNIELIKNDTKNMSVSWLAQTSGEKILSLGNQIQAMQIFQRIKKSIRTSFEQKQGFILRFVLSQQKSLKLLKKSLN